MAGNFDDLNAKVSNLFASLDGPAPSARGGNESTHQRSKSRHRRHKHKSRDESKRSRSQRSRKRRHRSDGQPEAPAAAPPRPPSGDPYAAYNSGYGGGAYGGSGYGAPPGPPGYGAVPPPGYGPPVPSPYGGGGVWGGPPPAGSAYAAAAAPPAAPSSAPYDKAASGKSSRDKTGESRGGDRDGRGSGRERDRGGDSARDAHKDDRDKDHKKRRSHRSKSRGGKESKHDDGKRQLEKHEQSQFRAWADGQGQGQSWGAYGQQDASASARPTSRREPEPPKDGGRMRPVTKASSLAGPSTGSSGRRGADQGRAPPSKDRLDKDTIEKLSEFLKDAGGRVLFSDVESVISVKKVQLEATHEFVLGNESDGQCFVSLASERPKPPGAYPVDRGGQERGADRAAAPVKAEVEPFGNLGDVWSLLD